MVTSSIDGVIRANVKVKYIFIIICVVKMMALVQPLCLWQIAHLNDFKGLGAAVDVLACLERTKTTQAA